MKQLLKERFQQLAGISTLYGLDETVDTRGDMPSLGQYDAEPEGSEYWSYGDIEFMMTELPEDTKVTVPDFDSINFGEPVQKVHKVFPKGATNIGYTLQGWLEEYKSEYPNLKFDVEGVAFPIRRSIGWGFEDRTTPLNISIKVVPGSYETDETTMDSEYEEMLAYSKRNRVDNKDTLGLTSPYGNKLDKWS